MGSLNYITNPPAYFRFSPKAVIGQQRLHACDCQQGTHAPQQKRSAVVTALVIYAAAAETGVPLNTIRVDALSAAGVILAVIAAGRSSVAKVTFVSKSAVICPGASARSDEHQ